MARPSESSYSNIQERNIGETMSTSSIIQTIVVLGIIAVALIYVLRRVIKTSRGKGDCGCGCGKDCKCKDKKKW